jgi:hypothetical protein
MLSPDDSIHAPCASCEPAPLRRHTRNHAKAFAKALAEAGFGHHVVPGGGEWHELAEVVL